MSLVPNILKKIYGPGKASGLYGIMFSYVGLMSILIIILQGAILTNDVSSYNLIFYVCGALSCVSLILLWTVFQEKKYEY